MIKYYRFKLRGKPVTRLVYTGEVSDDVSLQEYISKNSEVPVERWNPLEGIECNSSLDLKGRTRIGSCISCVLGVALRGNEA